MIDYRVGSSNEIKSKTGCIRFSHDELDTRDSDLLIVADTMNALSGQLMELRKEVKNPKIIKVRVMIGEIDFSEIENGEH